MNLRDLKYLVALADHSHFGKAANHCCVSQPALSMQIKKLEDTLGVSLIERSGKCIMLTPIGEIMVDRAKAILHEVDEMKQLAKSAKDPFCGELKMGIIPTFSPYVLPRIIPGLSKVFSKVTFYLIENQTHVLIQQLRQGNIDVAFLACPLTEPDFETQSLFDEEFLLAVHQSHPYAKRKAVTPTDLDNQSLLLLEEGHCMRDQALQYCHTARRAAENAYNATSIETLHQMVAANVGVTLIPKLAMRSQNGVSYLPFRSAKPKRRACLVWRKSSARVQLFKALASEIKELLLKEKNVKVVS